MPSPVAQTSPPHSLSLNTSLISNEPSWPDRPSISPITPTPSSASSPQPNTTAIATASDNSPKPQTQPPNLSLAENPDAIALRTAISILQLQRQQAITDIQTLDHLKTAALNNPQGFLADLKDNKLASPSQQLPSTQDTPSPSSTPPHPSPSRFPPIPSPQSVIRTPPINWSKYHIVGPSLDKLHTQQQRYPGITDAQIQQSGHPPKHEIAAPYRPGVDRLEENVKGLGQSKV